jgi:hypothetical protein
LCGALATTLLAMPGTEPPVAHACGGFWCSQDAPVNQAAERIIFVDHEDDQVTAIIQIQYVGPSEKFAWVIPIPGDPEIAVSADLAFQRLDGATRPDYRLERRVDGTCREDPEQDDVWERGGFQDAGAAIADAGDAVPAISVVDQGSVGPYDYATIAVDPALAEPAQAAIDWFVANGYDLTSLDAEVLGPYLADGLNLLAFKLTKTAFDTAGAIRPVILTYRGERPMIPIRPTAVAAERDMGVLVWIAADARAVPQNYKSLVLNDALIDWFNSGSNYNAVVTQAADEAGGQGFATELAGASRDAAQAVFSDQEQAQFETLAAASYEHGLDAIWTANGYYRNWDGWRDAIEAAVTLPPDTSLDEFASNPEAFRETAQVDTQRFFEALRSEVLAPVSETARLLGSRPYLTRLYSTMSADEMTLDPAFSYNAELPDVSNFHEAVQTVQCDPQTLERDAPWEVRLPGGDVVRGAGYEWPIDMDMLPANRKIEQLSTTGQGRVIEDNDAAIRAALRAMPDEAPAVRRGRGPSRVLERDPESPELGAETHDDCAVSAPGARGAGGAAIALALALAFTARRLGSRPRSRR